MLHTMAENYARKLGDKLNSDDKQIEIYTYGLETSLITSASLAVVLFLAHTLAILPTTLLALAVFAVFRCVGGGAHLSTYPRCFVLSTCLMLGQGFLPSIISIGLIPLLLLFISLIFITLYFTWKWVPADTEKRPVRDEKVRSAHKLYMSVCIIIWIISVSTLIKYGDYSLALAAITGALSSLFLISPWGYWLLRAIDKSLEKE